MEEIGCPELTDEELAFAGEIHASLNNPTNPIDVIAGRLSTEDAEWVCSQSAEPVANFVIPRIRQHYLLHGSTDVSDVSCICPTAQLQTSVWPTGTPAHSWQAVAMGKSSMAHEFMMYAAKTIAGTAVDIIEDPEKLASAKKEHSLRTCNKAYASPIPKDVKPAALGK
jgi:aminobenzoyl-glutamate utilization protein B